MTMSATLGGRLVVATGNPHKLHELQEMLGRLGLDIGCAPLGFAPLEDGRTFEANAALKARALEALLRPSPKGDPVSVLADDSGLVVDALGGAPGVHSARYAMQPRRQEPGADARGAQDAANRHKLMQALQHVPQDARRAHFVCVLALVDPNGTMQHFTGKVFGHIPLAPRGEGGFGYDAVFVPDGLQQTFAEAGAAAKARLSHRSRAIASMMQALTRS